MKFLGALLTASTVSISSFVYAEEPYDWSGPYVGANAGWAVGKSNVNTSVGCSTFIPDYFACNNQAVVQNSGSGSIDTDGFTAGLLAGYNWQKDSIVYGVEGDFGFMDLSGSRAVTSLYVGNAAGFPFTIGSSIDADWIGTMRGRFGTIHRNFLLYATGGIAFTNVKISNQFTDFNNAIGASDNSKLRTGWTAGVGFEGVLNANWLMAGEYLYADFGSITAEGTVRDPNFTSAVSNFTSATDLETHIFRIALKRKFSVP